MAKAENTYKEVVEINTKIKNLEALLESEREYLEKKRYQYRVESVCEVLDFIRDEYRAGRICNLETLLCHCQNKLHGNIDGVELCLNERYVDDKFQKVGKQNG